MADHSSPESSRTMKVVEITPLVKENMIGYFSDYCPQFWAYLDVKRGEIEIIDPEEMELEWIDEGEMDMDNEGEMDMDDERVMDGEGDIDEVYEDDDYEGKMMAILTIDRYIELPYTTSPEAYSIMEKFVQSNHLQEEHKESLKRKLRDALNKSKPFRRFKNILLDYPEEREQWFAFEKAHQWASILAYFDRKNVQLKVKEN